MNLSLFDGVTVTALDDERLSTQLALVYRALKSGGWWTLVDLSKASGASEAGASARCRDLRKDKFGAHRIERRRIGNGLYEYRMAA